MKRSFRTLNLSKFISVALCLTLLPWLERSSSGLAAPSNYTVSGTLGIYTMYLQVEPMCLGDSEQLSANVVASSIPISGATVTADGKAVATSGKSGFAKWTFKPKEAGEYNIVVAATKKNYFPSNSITISMSVEQCRWRFGMEYNEEYWIEDQNLALQAWEEFDVTLEEDANGAISVNGSSGQASINAQFAVSMYYYVAGAFECQSEREEGPASISFKGQLTKGQMTIELSAYTLALASQLTITCQPLNENGTYPKPFTVNKNPKPDLLGKARPSLKRLVFSAKGNDVKKFQVPKGVFWGYGKRIYSGGVIFLQRLTNPK
jgi:hypothetical protein